MGKKISTKILKQKLNSLNRLACLLTANLTGTTPQMSLEIILNIEPLDIHIKMGTHMLSTWIKSITGHNNLAYFQSKLNPHVDYAYKLMKPFTI